MRIGNLRFPIGFAIPLGLFLMAVCSFAAGSAELRGTVVDPVGGVVSHAEVQLLHNKTVFAQTTTDDVGQFAFSSLKPGRYEVRASASGFSTQDSQTVYVGKAGISQVSVSLRIGVVAEQIVVSATGSPVLDSQVGASVSTVRQEDLRKKLDVSDALGGIPGIQVLQTAERGGTTDLFIRGANADANKVLLDGIPVNDIGGGAEFGNLGTTGIDQAEVLRGPNSVLYGADALAGVVNLTTIHGTKLLPQLTYSLDGGNFDTKRQEISVGGAHGPLDYFSDFSRFDTRNSEPNSAFHNGTYAGNFGWAQSASTQVRITLRRTATALGLPNALDVYGIPDSSFQNEHDTYVGVTVQNQTMNHWHNLLRYGGTRLRLKFEDPSPAGQPFPSTSGINFLGNPVVLRGANGFEATGRAILDFAGTYPLLFDTRSTRDFVYAQSDYTMNRHLSGLLAFRFENEQGFTRFAGTKTPTDRNNLDYTAQGNTNLWDRLYITAGVGVEKNAIFGTAVTPRISFAYYLARLRSAGFLNGTKVRFNFGDGIKEPAIFDESTSLFVLLSQLSNGTQLISQFHVKPIGAERSRSFDFGVDQIAWNGHAKLGLTLFHSQFSDQIEFVSSPALTQLGIPPAVAAATPFGASVNSGAFRARGAEFEVQLNFGHGLVARGSYTYLDDIVESSFVSSALTPAFNPAFPTIPIGNSPLVGNRPFRRAPQSGAFEAGYSGRRFTAVIDGNLVGRRDDSTHAVDAFFGPTLLLPNRNLDSAYQKIDLHGSFRVNSMLDLYTNLENITRERYDAAFGFPSLPFTFRTGVKLTLGGESWTRH